ETGPLPVLRARTLGREYFKPSADRAVLVVSDASMPLTPSWPHQRGTTRCQLVVSVRIVAEDQRVAGFRWVTPSPKPTSRRNRSPCCHAATGETHSSYPVWSYEAPRLVVGVWINIDFTTIIEENGKLALLR